MDEQYFDRLRFKLLDNMKAAERKSKTSPPPARRFGFRVSVVV
jgi:hypothetical protein